MIKVEIIEGEQMKANRGEKEILGMDLLSFFHVFDFSILGLLLLLDDDIIIVVYTVSAKFLPL